MATAQMFASIESTATTRKESNAMATPEELIAAMTTEELQELLEEMGIEATQSQASGIKSLVRELGTLEAALETIAGFGFEDRRAA